MLCQAPNAQLQYVSSATVRYTVSGTVGHGSRVEASGFRSTLCLPDIPVPGYRLRSPLWIEIEKSEQYVISQPDTGVFTYNADLSIALDQFYDAFIDQYNFLRANAPRLSNSLSRELGVFEGLVEPC